MLKLGRLYYTSRGFDLLTSLKKCNWLFTWNKLYESTCIPHHFLYSISEKCCTNFKPLFLVESTNFHHFPISTVVWDDWQIQIMPRSHLCRKCFEGHMNALFIIKVKVILLRGGRTDPYIGTLLDDCTHVSKVPMYELFHLNPHACHQLSWLFGQCMWKHTTDKVVIQVLSIMLIVDLKIVNILSTHNLVYSKPIFSWYSLLDPHIITYHSNIGVQIIASWTYPRLPLIIFNKVREGPLTNVTMYFSRLWHHSKNVEKLSELE